jgi:hypothetical protein
VRLDLKPQWGAAVECRRLEVKLRHPGLCYSRFH